MGDNESESTRLARIETKIDALLKIDDDHEKRLRFLERSIYIALVIAGAVGAWLRDVIPNIGS